MVKKFNIELEVTHLRRLRPGIWLNGDIICFYFQMLQVRNVQLHNLNKNRRKSHFFSTYFITKLLYNANGYEYGNVKRWTKHIDIFLYDKIFFPINLNNSHWMLAVIFMQRQEIHFYDSYHSKGINYLDGLKRWIMDESIDKKGIRLNPNEWKTYSHTDDIPLRKSC
jgi:Ulp1 family protease